MNTKKHMPVAGLDRSDMTGWISRAVKFGVVPPDSAVIGNWMTLAQYCKKEVMDLLTNTPASFEHKPGFEPLEKNSENYKHYNEAKIAKFENHLANHVEEIKNKLEAK